MIIDSHQHVFWQGWNDKQLVAEMDERQIDVAWLLTWAGTSDLTSPSGHSVFNPAHREGDGSIPCATLGDIIQTRDRYPDRFIAGYCPNPAVGYPAEQFQAAYQIHKVRVCGEWGYRMLFDDPRCINLYRTAGKLKCPVVLHIDVAFLPNGQGQSIYQRDWYGGTIDNLARALEACPETNFIGHAPAFWREISGDADQAPSAYPKGKVMPGGKVAQYFKRYPNLYADLSAGSGLNALMRDPAFAIDFVLEFADRLLFGRDYYGGELHAFLASLDLPADVRQKIMSGNAQKLVNLEQDMLPAQTRKLFNPD